MHKSEIYEEISEEKIREMLKDIINNNAEYEYTFKDCYGDYVPWMKYKLGEEIRSQWKFRKVEKWYVYKTLNADNDYTMTTELYRMPREFEGTKEECETWIKNNAPKTWLDERAKNFAEDNVTLYFAKMDGTAPDDRDKLEQTYRTAAMEVCNKINEWVSVNSNLGELDIHCLRKFIKSLGISI